MSKEAHHATNWNGIAPRYADRSCRHSLCRLGETKKSHTTWVRAETESRRKSILQRESDIYLTVYRELLREVEAYCGEHGIAVVYAVRDEEIDPGNPSDVLRAIQRKGVWHEPDAQDITEDIVQRVNARSTGKR